MKSKNDMPGRSGSAVEIKPIPFRPGNDQKHSTASGMLKGLLGLALGVFLILLCASAWFVFTARQVVIRIDPKPDYLALKGGLIAPKFGDHYLMRPGDYVLEAAKECFQPLREALVVQAAKTQEFKFALTREPGRLSLTAHQADAPTITLAGALVSIDGQPRGRTPLTGLAVEPGRRSLTVQAENYQVWQAEIEVAGCGEAQQFDLALIPGWAEISLKSEPAGAAVWVDGKSVGTTPLTLNLPAGDHDLALQADGFKPWRTRLAVVANQPRELETVRLQPADGKLAVRTRPAGASVMVDKTFAGQSPLDVALTADTPHLVQVSKAGYEEADRTVILRSEESKTLDITLTPQMGIINFVVQPADAELFVDGKPMGRVPAALRLVALEHLLDIKRKGFQPFQTRITPRPGFAQEINVVLAKLSSSPTTPPGIIRAKNGYELILVRPGDFTMGSSRREQGRRSNESLREIRLQRPFYMGLREVTNQEVRQFLAAHNSGSFKKQSLDADPLPAVDLSWEQAALFCNWLSVKESLKPVYVQKNGRLAAADPLGNGYRLPSEAEWEYSARFSPNRAGLKYPWGDAYPPPAGAGNFADASARDLLTNVLPSYNDGYAVSAPPATFGKNALGLYDLGGNVAEWCHDYYAIYPYNAQKVYVDPRGPEQGKYHVIKGSSWMQAGISELRLAYRDYSDTKRLDLGFRVCRYVK